MLQVARLAPKTLGAEATHLVKQFLLSQLHASGGFSGRDGSPDLYYTVFGIEGLLALQADLPHQSLAQWLATHTDGSQLDFIHLCCLIRSQAAMQNTAWLEQHRSHISTRLEEQHRTPCGGYHVKPKQAHGNAYASLLAFAAYEDLRLPLPQAQRLRDCLDGLRTADHAWSNEAGLPLGMAPPTAAVLTLYRRMSWPTPPQSLHWLLSCLHDQGGFLAFPQAPLPDLLTTAVVLHSLASSEANLQPLQEPCLDFIDSLWSAAGGFHGNWTDHELDCEYTYYGLLALGHLSL
jgi:hypothetical protein